MMINELNVQGSKQAIYSGHLKLSGKSPSGDTIDFTNFSMTYNGRPYFSIIGEFHYSRYPESKWEEELMKMKACGLDTVATYMFWNFHEFYEGRFDFSGNRNIRKFVELCGKHHLWVILRVGPYAHGECRNGGLPDWLFGRPFEVRSNDQGYLAYVGRYYEEVGKQVAGLMFTQGGPITGIQLENEYMAACSPWEITVPQNREWVPQGTGGLKHIEILKSLAGKAGLRSAYYTATGWGDAPYIDNEMLPLWGGYAYWPWLYWDKDAKFDHPPTYGYLFKDQHDETVKDGFDKKYPFACCEMGGGMQAWYPYRFVVEPESVEAMSLVTVAGGCNYLGYYMFHGGLNPVIDNVTMNEQLTPRISYDFQAPLGDCGQPGESYKRIKLLHYFYKDFNEELCTMKTVIPPGQSRIEPSDTKSLRYAARSNGRSGILFINNFQDHVPCEDHKDVQIEILTDSRTVRFPHRNTMTVPKGMAGAFLFNTVLSDLLLEDSTASYITKIEVPEGIPTYFFFTHEGMSGEFCFDGVWEIDFLDGCRASFPGEKTFVEIGDVPVASFILRNKNRQPIRFVCLDRAQSLDFWKIRIGRQDYAVITPVNVYSSGDTLSLEVIDRNAYDMLLYPDPLFKNPPCPGPTVENEWEISGGRLSAAGSAHGMGCYHVACDLPRMDFKVQKIYENRAEIVFDPGQAAGLSELYLYVDYIGDIGWAFIDGHLIHDDFSNGTTWKIALSEHMERLKTHNLYLYLSPLADENASVKSEGASTHAKISVSKDRKACFKSIRLVSEKTQEIAFCP